MCIAFAVVSLLLMGVSAFFLWPLEFGLSAVLVYLWADLANGFK
jgi:hypothetical protein